MGDLGNTAYPLQIEDLKILDNKGVVINDSMLEPIAAYFYKTDRSKKTLLGSVGQFSPPKIPYLLSLVFKRGPAKNFWAWYNAAKAARDEEQDKDEYNRLNGGQPPIPYMVINQAMIRDP